MSKTKKNSTNSPLAESTSFVLQGEERLDVKSLLTNGTDTYVIKFATNAHTITAEADEREANYVTLAVGETTAYVIGEWGEGETPPFDTSDPNTFVKMQLWSDAKLTIYNTFGFRPNIGVAIDEVKSLDYSTVQN